jgi:hypothetical protein
MDYAANSIESMSELCIIGFEFQMANFDLPLPFR